MKGNPHLVPGTRALKATTTDGLGVLVGKYDAHKEGRHTHVTAAEAPPGLQPALRRAEVQEADDGREKDGEGEEAPKLQSTK